MPTLWYLNDMMFICEQEMPRECTSDLDSTIIDEEAEAGEKLVECLDHLPELLFDVTEITQIHHANLNE